MGREVEEHFKIISLSPMTITLLVPICSNFWKTVMCEMKDRHMNNSSLLWSQNMNFS